MNSAPKVAIVGATGAVGREFLAVLGKRDFPVGDLRLLASSRSAGRELPFRGKSYTVEELGENSFASMDLALFSASGSISKKYAPIASAAGCSVVDNSSAFRMDPDTPLVVPEVNPDAVEGMQVGQGGIVANPNCSTIIMLVPVTPLRAAAGLKRLVVSTYQAASGAGAAAMAELQLQTREVLAGDPPTCNVFDRQYAFNLFSHNSDIGDDGYNTEETKMVRESRRIWNDDAVQITATCVRVPVMRAHAESINLEFTSPLSEEDARSALAQAPGIRLIDDRAGNHFPTPLEASGEDEILVGRIRQDISRNGERTGLDLFVCGDQLLKGAALNAVQIAELLL